MLQHQKVGLENVRWFDQVVSNITMWSKKKRHEPVVVYSGVDFEDKEHGMDSFVTVPLK